MDPYGGYLGGGAAFASACVVYPELGGICMTPQKGALSELAVYLASQNIWDAMRRAF